MTKDLNALIERLDILRAAATPGPYRAHDHNDMARLGEDPEKWMGHAWVGRVTPQSGPDGRFDAGWLDRDSGKDGSREYRDRASADAHFVAEALNALPMLLQALRDRQPVQEEEVRVMIESLRDFAKDEAIRARLTVGAYGLAPRHYIEWQAADLLERLSTDLEAIRAAMRRYLPPDSGITAEEFASEVIGIVDRRKK